MSGQTNIDDVRAEIMRLESAAVFDGLAWLRVLADLASRPSALADAQRRMETALQNAAVIVETLDAVEMAAQPEVLYG